MEYRKISEINYEIENLSTVFESVNEDVKDGIMSSLHALYEEKYQTVLNEEAVVEEMYESGSIDEDDYNKYMTELTAIEEDVQDTIYPFMTEAVAATSVSIIKKELKELEGGTAKKFNKLSTIKKMGEKTTWLNDRYMTYADAAGIEIINECENITEADGSEKAIWKKSGKEICSMTLTKKDGKTTIKKTLTNVPKDASLLYDVIMLSSFLYAGPKTKTLISKMKSFWKKELSNATKDLKEYVLDTVEGGYETVLENVELSLNTGMIDEETSDTFKEFIETIYEKSLLEESLEKEW